MNRSDFVEQTTDNMIEILNDKIKYNQLVIDQFKDNGKPFDHLEATNKQFNATITFLTQWNGCL